jgi:hypothetical protein
VFPLAPPFAPPTPTSLVLRRSPASSLLWRGLTSPARASPASAPRLPDAGRPDKLAAAELEISRFRAKSVRACQGLRPRRVDEGLALARLIVLPSTHCYRVGTRNQISFAAQWLDCTHPCRRFADTLTGGSARLGADATRYVFIAMDFHHLLFAGLYWRTTRQIASTGPFH